MSTVLVSVIVPAYNHEQYVMKALDSVVEQSYPTIELIVIDDCSTDATADVIARWCESGDIERRFDRIQFVRNESNLGAHASLNRGIALAAGEYLCFLNSDDYFASSRIETLLQHMDCGGSRFAFSAVMPVDDAGRRTLGSPLARRIATAREEIAVLPSVSFGFLYRQLAISTGNFILHRSVYDEIGGFAPLRYCHDWDFALRAFLRTEPVFVDDYLYFYRFHASNSFPALSDVARQETDAVLGNYYAQCLISEPANDKAPTPYNWPGVFEHYIEFFELEFLWNKICREHGYENRYETPDLGVARLSRYASADDSEAGRAPLTRSLRDALASKVSWLMAFIRRA